MAERLGLGLIICVEETIRSNATRLLQRLPTLLRPIASKGKKEQNATVALMAFVQVCITLMGTRTWLQHCRPHCSRLPKPPPSRTYDNKTFCDGFGGCLRDKEEISVGFLLLAVKTATSTFCRFRPQRIGKVSTDLFLPEVDKATNFVAQNSTS